MKDIQKYLFENEVKWRVFTINKNTMERFGSIEFQIVAWLSNKKKIFVTLKEMDDLFNLTMILSHINYLSDKFIFKDYICLNKIYYVYYRLCEDLTLVCVYQ